MWLSWLLASSLVVNTKKWFRSAGCENVTVIQMSLYFDANVPVSPNRIELVDEPYVAVVIVATVGVSGPLAALTLLTVSMPAVVPQFDPDGSGRDVPKNSWFVRWYGVASLNLYDENETGFPLQP
jgi:hypothetical protein